MDRSIIMLVIGLVLGGGIGFVFAAGNNITLDGHDHAAQGSQHAMASSGSDMAGQHNHDALLEVAEAQAPAIEASVTQDAASGWNLKITTRNFRLAPEHASGKHVEGEGHAHVHVNGVKIARLYGEWLHIAELPKGENTVEVTLTTNDHRALAVDGKPVSDSVTVGVE